MYTLNGVLCGRTAQVKRWSVQPANTAKNMRSSHAQAFFPAGAQTLSNSNGTAPGFSIQLGDTPIFFLPGVPREMKRMFTEQVLPRVRPQAPNNTFQVRLRTYGLGESSIGQARSSR